MNRRPTPHFEPELYEHLTAPQNTEKVVAAMKLFLLEGDEEKFEIAVALYVASARYRQEPIERVVSPLCLLAGDLESAAGKANEFLPEPSRMHELIFSGILRAFYGDPVVDRALGASAQRKADAPQHIKSGTWPKKPVE